MWNDLIYMTMANIESTTKVGVRTDMKVRLGDILMALSWREIAKNYFGKSSSWLYHKMDGIDGNGGVGGFSDSEAMQLKDALIDLSDRIRAAADRI